MKKITKKIVFIALISLSASSFALAPIWWGISIGAHISLLAITYFTSDTVTPSGTSSGVINIYLDEPTESRAPSDWPDENTPPATSEAIVSGGENWKATDVYNYAALDPDRFIACNAAAQEHAVYVQAVGNGSGFKGTLPGTCTASKFSCQCTLTNVDDTAVTNNTGWSNTFTLEKVNTETTCDAGYTSNAGVCELTDPAVPTWKTDGACDVSLQPGVDLFVAHARDPDCLGVIWTNQISVTDDDKILQVDYSDATGEITVQQSNPQTGEFQNFTIDGPTGTVTSVDTNVIPGTGSVPGTGTGTGGIGACGGINEPKCGVSIDETGTPSSTVSYQTELDSIGIDALTSNLTDGVTMAAPSWSPPIPNGTTTCQTIPMSYAGFNYTFPSVDQCSKLNQLKTIIAWFLYILTGLFIFQIAVRRPS
ncbi:MAG: hypothetical protein RRB22_12165 [Gammaproteobacteria bacterium]|nr:hypothetical protein [Gammaproteobacteria bacterium]